MFRFANPAYLYLLLLIPVFVGTFIMLRIRMKRNLAKFGAKDLLRDLMPDVSPLRTNIKFALMMLALGLLSVLLARPQFGTRSEEVKRKGIEAIIAVDVSNSMLCQDVTPSRLEKSKMIVSKLVEQLDEDKIGLVAFAGNAITLLPVTADYVSAKMFLNQLDPSTIPVQGTNVSDAIAKALAGFSDNKAVGKALILITDAEDHEDGAIEAAKAADDKGIRVFVLSVGTEAGGPIPMGGKYKTDRSGNVVTTRLNETIGKEIAQAGNGFYVNVSQGDAAQTALQQEIDKMQKEDISASMYSDYDEQFVAVAILIFVVLIIEICIMEKKNPLFKNLKLFDNLKVK